VRGGSCEAARNSIGRLCAAGKEHDRALVTLHGSPVRLIGHPVQVDQAAPDFLVLGNDLGEVAFSSFRGRPCLISSVPSLDTEVCDTEARRLNREAAALCDDLDVLIISMDLPFAQKRWCAAAGIERVMTLSDHRDASFGTAYGVLIKDIRLLARAVFVVSRRGRVRYVEVVEEITHEPDYDRLLEALRAVC